MCDIDAITTVQFVNNFIQRLGWNGFPLFQSTGSLTTTFTSSGHRPVEGRLPIKVPQKAGGGRC